VGRRRRVDSRIRRVAAPAGEAAADRLPALLGRLARPLLARVAGGQLPPRHEAASLLVDDDDLAPFAGVFQ